MRSFRMSVCVCVHMYMFAWLSECVFPCEILYKCFLAASLNGSAGSITSSSSTTNTIYHLKKKKRENKGNKNKQRKIEARELQKSMAQFAPFQVCVCVYVCVWVVVCDDGVGKRGVGLPVCAQRPSYNVAYA